MKYIRSIHELLILAVSVVLYVVSITYKVWFSMVVTTPLFSHHGSFSIDRTLLSVVTHESCLSASYSQLSTGSYNNDTNIEV